MLGCSIQGLQGVANLLVAIALDAQGVEQRVHIRDGVLFIRGSRLDAARSTREKEFFIDNLLVRIHFIVVMMRWNGLAPWVFKTPFPGSPTSTFALDAQGVEQRVHIRHGVLFIQVSRKHIVGKGPDTPLSTFYAGKVNF